MRPIFLIGFMCSGKTTLGTAAGHAAGIVFVDLDHAVEQAAGMTVREIFSHYGEAHFRRLENEMLRKYAGTQDVIVACGGGTPCTPGAMELMNRHGTTVYLKPSEQRLVHRLMSGRHKRPLIASIADEDTMLEFAREKIAAREPYYSQAAYTFDSSMLDTPFEVSITTQEFVDRFCSQAPETI